jgi:sugar phosphate isomerase/epimerase
MTLRWAVSTLGMPGASIPEAVQTALEGGCAGLELRVHPDEQIHLGMTPAQARDARARIADGGLEVVALAGYPTVCRQGPDDAVVAELRSLIELAARLGAPAVRVFPGGNAAGDDGPARQRIGAVLPDLRDAGVRLLVETHDSHPTGEAALRLVSPFAAPDRVGVLWDALHTWRAGEPPSLTRHLLGDYLGHVQVKDVVSRQDTTPVRPGTGQLPLEEFGRAWRSWSGWVSLEWERAWNPHIEPVCEALRSAQDWFRRWNRPGDSSKPGSRSQPGHVV